MLQATEQPEPAVLENDWPRIEDRFRVHAFGVYYSRTFRDELDPSIRFVKALIASAQPIQDRKAVIDWYLEQRKRRKSNA